MHVSTFDRYETGESLIHRLDARVKVVVTVLFILSNVLLPDGAWLAFLLAWAMVLAVNLLAGLKWSYALKRSLIALPFALAAITVIFSIPGQPVFTLNVGPWQWTASEVGLIRFASIVIRSWLSVQMAILLVAVTEFPKIIHALAHLRMPAIITVIISFLYRYLFVLKVTARGAAGRYVPAPARSYPFLRSRVNTGEWSEGLPLFQPIHVARIRSASRN